jgi:thiamine pyrophosphate-dependent acetolactate synthase large subunit-like protein
MSEFIAPQAPTLGWASDVAAEMLRRTGLKYISLVPGASFRGLHDSIVNYLGNQDPEMVLCLTEQAAVGIAHGYAKVTGKPMGVALHANIGVMHAAINIFDAFADRVPMVIMGATGPVDAAKRRPWIDWIHTAADQAAMVRDYLKWDDQPGSAEAIAESVLRAFLMASTAPMGPTYVCLDAALQESPLDGPMALPDPKYFPVAAAPGPDAEGLARATATLKAAKKVVILAGRVSRDEQDWTRRIALAEALNAKVYTALKLAASFPNSHPLHEGILPLFQSKDHLTALSEADVILSLDWIDVKAILEATDRTEDDSLTMIHVSLDRYAHTGAVMDYLGLPRADIMLLADPDTTTRALLTALEKPETAAAVVAQPGVNVVPKSRTISMAHLAEATTRALQGRKACYACLPFGWPAAASPFDHPLDYLGADAGGVIGAGPPFAIGAALAMRDTDPDRLVVCATGDGDLLSGMASLWTAAQRKLPILAIINNNRSFMNDERHQDRVAQARGRPRENKWVGQRLDDPPPDLCGLAKAQGWAAVGPVALPEDLPAAFDRAMASIARGRPTLIDVLVDPEV